MPGRRFDSFGSTPDAPERPADPAVRKANLRRIFPLFRPYRARLSAVCALIVFSAAIGVISPFLLREVLDVAIPEQDMQLLTALVAGMVAIPIISGAVLVYVTLLSKPIGQVLCGPFTGPGSEAMAVTFNAPTCWSPQGWAVFHFTDGDWRLALNQKGVFLAGPQQPDRRHARAYLALGRLPVYGRPLEAGEAPARSPACGEERLLQDALREHRLLPLARPRGPTGCVPRLRDQDRPQACTAPPPVRKWGLRWRPGRVVRDRPRTRAGVCGRSRPVHRAGGRGAGSRLRQDLEWRRPELPFGVRRTDMPQQERPRLLPQPRALA